ncbi:MAG TPA: hypothetical protein VLZ56_06000, partial [Mycoplana sp.]|nr:hypothetical protein [Mycoplana sp.]
MVVEISHAKCVTPEAWLDRPAAVFQNSALILQPAMRTVFWVIENALPPSARPEAETASDKTRETPGK